MRFPISEFPSLPVKSQLVPTPGPLSLTGRHLLKKFVQFLRDVRDGQPDDGG